MSKNKKDTPVFHVVVSMEKVVTNTYRIVCPKGTTEESLKQLLTERPYEMYGGAYKSSLAYSDERDVEVVSVDVAPWSNK